MTTTSRLSRLLVLLAGVAGSMMVHPALLHAGDRVIEIEKDAETVPIYVERGKVTRVAFASKIFRWEHKAAWLPRLNKNTIGIEVPKGTRDEDVPGTIVVFAQRHTVTLEVQLASSAEKRDGSVTIQPKELSALMNAVVEAKVKERMAGELGKMEAKIDQLQRHNKREAQRIMVRSLHQGYETRLLDTSSCSGKNIVLCGLRWGTVDDDGLLRFSVYNRSAQWIDVGQAIVWDEHQLVEHTGPVYIEGQPRQENLLTSIPPMTRVEGSIIVKQPESVGNMIQLVLKGPSSLLPAAQWIDLQPPLQPARGIVTLSAVASYGAIWLAEGTGMNRLDAASVEAYGARITYAFNEYIHVEALAALARSGNAEFEGATLNNMTGNLARSATLGRLQIGGLLRWGKTVMPTVRLGVGVQGGRLTSELAPDGGALPVTKSSSAEFGYMWWFSAGVDVRLGHDLLLGAALLGEQSTESDSWFRRSASAGVHLGYSWKP